MVIKYIADVELAIVNSVNAFLSESFLVKCESAVEGSSLLLNHALGGRYEQALQTQIAQQLLCGPDDVSTSDSLVSVLSKNISDFLFAEDDLQKSGDSDTTDVDSRELRRLLLLCVGVSCLQLFTQNNWVGPPSSLQPLSLLPKTFQHLSEADVSLLVCEYLTVGDEDNLFSLSHHSLFLFLSRVCLIEFSQHISQLVTGRTWQIRCLYIQQQLLEDRSPSLKSSIVDIIDNASKILDPEFHHYLTSVQSKSKLSTINDKQPVIEVCQPVSHTTLSSSTRDHLIQFHIESGYIRFFYYQSIAAAAHMQRAKALSGLKLELTGALGKRTRFQEKDLPQLLLSVSRVEGGAGEVEGGAGEVEGGAGGVEGGASEREESGVIVNSSVELKPNSLPKNISLDDEAVLEVMKLSNPDDVPLLTLTSLEQALALCLCYELRRMHEGQDKIVQEESMAYINGVLSEPRCWSVQCKALLMRVRWERDSPRRIQRSLQQLEELVNQYKKKTGGDTCDTSSYHRLELVYTSALPPKWIIERELAMLLMSLGATASALEIYLRLLMWDDVIQCYAALGQLDKAEKVIREQLSVSPSATLWCYLGDVLHDPQHYHTAWEISQHKSMRAQRCLAYYHLRKQQFRESLEHFDKCLQINPLQANVWFSYGCASLSCTEYEAAASAFRHCVNLENENHEAWSNLATAYIRLNNKPRAFLTLQEALKCDYENWRIWENYIHVAADVGDFEEVIRSYHRLIELRQKYSNVDVVGVLVRAIQKNVPDCTGEPALRLRQKALELIGRITSQVTSSAELWRLYAELIINCPDTQLTDVDRERALQCRQKAQRCCIQSKDWETDTNTRTQAVQLSIDLANGYREEIERLREDETHKTKVTQYRSSARLMINGITSKLQKRLTEEHSEETLTSLNNQIAQLQTVVQNFTE